jgi:cytochrome c oxidase assembly protein subunit 15
MTSSPDMPSNRNAPGGRALRWAATLTAVAIFPLVIVGAGVTSKGVGMAYPDWPTSAGHLVNPPQWWQGDGTRWEHGHRLIGWVVGMLAVLVAVSSWRRRGAMRVLGCALLGAIVVQGVLGGLRVTEVSTALAMVHGVWGQLCFCLACAIAWMTSRTWHELPTVKPMPAVYVLQRVCLGTTAAVLVQLVLGGALRHFAADAALVAHLMWAVVVVLMIGWVAMWVLAQPASLRPLVRFGWTLAALTVMQLMLGGAALVVTVMGGWRGGVIAWAIPSAHTAVGALLLATLAMTTLAAFRLQRAPASCHNARANAVAVL